MLSPINPGWDDLSMATGDASAGCVKMKSSVFVFEFAWMSIWLNPSGSSSEVQVLENAFSRLVSAGMVK